MRLWLPCCGYLSRNGYRLWGIEFPLIYYILADTKRLASCANTPIDESYTGTV
jgi:hypothetical protein